MGKSSVRNNGKNVTCRVAPSLVSTRKPAETQEGRRGQELYVWHFLESLGGDFSYFTVEK